MPRPSLPAALRHRGHPPPTPPERRYDDLAALAAAVCEAPMGAVVLTHPGGPVLAGACGLAASHATPHCEAEIILDGHRAGTVSAAGFDPDSHTERHRAALRAVARQAARQLELERREAELELLAMTDPLTEVGNRRLLDAALGFHLSAPSSTGRLGLVFCDIDDFKPINDRHGHDAGDRLLHGFARQLRAIAGEHDVVARIAGDEFVLASPHLPDPAALERLAARVRSVTCRPPHPGTRPVRISAGAALAEPGDRPRDLLRRADAAMYAEKARRRALSAEAQRFAGPRPLRPGPIVEPAV